jgi:hypothetical protein
MTAAVRPKGTLANTRSYERFDAARSEMLLTLSYMLQISPNAADVRDEIYSTISAIRQLAGLAGNGGV